MDFIMGHQVILGMVILWAFSAFVSGMPAPTEKDTRAYQWAYSSLHVFVGNLDKKFGGQGGYVNWAANLFLTLTMLCFMIAPLIVYGCTANYKVHPGAISTVDSQGYDILIAAQSIITQSRADLDQGKLPESLVPTFNKLVASYNVTRGAWLTYRGAVATNTPYQDFLNQLNRDVADLTAAITEFKGSK